MMDAAIDASQIRFVIAVLVGPVALNDPVYAICDELLQNAYSSAYRKAFHCHRNCARCRDRHGQGLTVPFALAAGLAAAVSSTKVIVTAGLAEIVAGAIAMGLGGYLAARTDAEHYGSERAREDWEIDNLRDKEVQEVTGIFRGYGLQATL
jgi:hypothetical protein